MSVMRTHESWGRYPASFPQAIFSPAWRDDPPVTTPLLQLPYGMGRSYGDVCLNTGGAIIDTKELRHVISFDVTQGILVCEGGMTFEDVLALCVPQGWFLPVTPGTKYITVGGAIANDIHGKNHHRAGTFGSYVRCFELLRSNGERLRCSPTEHAELFGATIGGLGLTGLITWVEFSLLPVETSWIKQESIRFGNLEEFFVLSRESDKDYAYTVAWLDSTAPLRSLGRGLFMRGNHATAAEAPRAAPRPPLTLSVPCDMPSWFLNRSSIQAFNTLYGHRQLSKRKRQCISYEPFFYPLDKILHWNRLYGKTGFLQYQCVVPFAQAIPALQELFVQIHRSKLASFLSVLKVFGDRPSPGLLSFPSAGATLALDIRFEGEKTLRVLNKLDEIVNRAQGRVYPAKDARMSGEHFRAWYPAWETLERYRDPGYSSDFWRRVTQF